MAYVRTNRGLVSDHGLEHAVGHPTRGRTVGPGDGCHRKSVTSAAGPPLSRTAIIVGMDTTTPAIELRDLVKTFHTPGARDTVRAVDGVDLTIEPGEVVAFLGPNGAGKTTTLDMRARLTLPKRQAA